MESSKSKRHSLRNFASGASKADVLHGKSLGNPGCEGSKCLGSLMRPPPDRPVGTTRSVEEIREHAQSFIKEYYQSLKNASITDCDERIRDVLPSIKNTGTYELTTEELLFGVKTAWRNAPRCIGRIQWKNLQLYDGRQCKTATDMYSLLLQHMKYADNGGNIRSCITVFPARTSGRSDFRVWNPLLISFAGYKKSDGTILGDPANVEFTEVCLRLGWKGKGSNFDVLPWVLQANGEKPEWFEVPESHARLVNITHPKLEWFKDLRLKWYAVPAVSNMLLDCGGVEFPAAPFNGWYMGTEVGSRDLCDPSRYNMIERIGRMMGLDVRQSVNLWKDQVLVEVNLAVLHSYRLAGVTMVDHHTASEQFMSHLETEYRVRGGCPADWVWIVPPMSSSITPVFHMEMLHYRLKPSYEYQANAWRSYKFDMSRARKLTVKTLSRVLLLVVSLMRRAMAKRKKCTILYATETGRSKEFAMNMHKVMSYAFNSRMVCMEAYDYTDLCTEEILLVIASTFGNGDPPENGRSFYDFLRGRKSKQGLNNLEHIKYSAFALGSSAYPCFCAFGENVDHELEQLGGQRIYPLVKGDELQGQEESFKAWARETFLRACTALSVDSTVVQSSIMSDLLGDDLRWAANDYKISLEETDKSNLDLIYGLERIHKRKVSVATVKNVTQLQSVDSERKTICVSLLTEGSESLDYEPGDHIAIYPANDQILVDNIIRKLDIDIPPDSIINVKFKSKKLDESSAWENDNRLPHKVSLRVALTHFLDLTTPPSQSLLDQYAHLASSNQDRSELEHLAKDATLYSNWRCAKMPNLLDMLRMYPSLRLEASFLLTQLPLQQPRYYSISSAPSLYPNEIHLTVAVVNYQTQDGILRNGLCSNWLNSLQGGNDVMCFIRNAPSFRLPSKKSVPIICVGPGTGVAPLRSFWQQRYVEKITDKLHGDYIAPLSLYFGCRFAEKDNLYIKEKADMIRAGVITQHLALSREKGLEKTYVQDLLKKNGRFVYRDLIEKQGHIYVCGDVGMAADVKSTIMEILEMCGEMTSEKAKNALETLRISNNYHEDIYGTLKIPQTSTKPKKRTAYSDDPQRNHQMNSTPAAKSQRVMLE